MIHDGHMFFGGSGFMWIFWVLVLVGIVFLFMNMNRGNSGSASMENESPLDILKKRYARGEIDEDEYQRRRKELES